MYRLHYDADIEKAWPCYTPWVVKGRKPINGSSFASRNLLGIFRRKRVTVVYDLLTVSASVQMTKQKKESEAGSGGPTDSRVVTGGEMNCILARTD